MKAAWRFSPHFRDPSSPGRPRTTLLLSLPNSPWLEFSISSRATPVLLSSSFAIPRNITYFCAGSGQPLLLEPQKRMDSPSRSIGTAGLVSESKNGELPFGRIPTSQDCPHFIGIQYHSALCLIYLSPTGSDDDFLPSVDLWPNRGYLSAIDNG
jgi:hypothetical protein